MEFVPTYGNTLMGLACHKPFDPADDYAIIYHPPCPRAMIEVVDPKESTTRRLRPGGSRAADDAHQGVFHAALPRARRSRAYPPCEAYPWDGVRNVRPFSRFQSSVTEGVY